MNALHELYIPHHIPDGAFIQTLFCKISAPDAERESESAWRKSQVCGTKKSRVAEYLSDGNWHSTKEIERATGAGRATMWHMQRCGEIVCDDQGRRNGKLWKLVRALT